MITLLSLFACQAPPVENAGDPSELVAYGDVQDELFSALTDDGWDNVPGTYNIVYKSSPQDFLATKDDLALSLRDGDVVREFERIPVLTVSMTYEEALRFAERSDVVAVEPDWLAHTDARHGTTSCAVSTSESIPTGVAAMGSGASNGSGVKVAVIDTGIDTTHSDLSVVSTVNKIDATKSGADDNGHGTHVSGTIAGLSNSSGVTGVAPGVSLYGVKVLDSRGSGSYSTIASGIDWSVANGMNVGNMSLGGPTNSTTLHTAVTAAKAANLVLVVAAGNDGGSANNQYPGAYDGEVLTVSAVDVSTGVFATWSDYGSVVDVAGHGVNVCSAKKGGGWTVMSGTSMAAPHVTGAVAVYLGSHSGASFSSVESAIEGSVSALGNTTKHTEDLSVLTSL